MENTNSSDLSHFGVMLTDFRGIYPVLKTPHYIKRNLWSGCLGVLWEIDSVYIAVIVIDCVLVYQLNFTSEIRGLGFRGFEKNLKNGVFRVQNGMPREEGCHNVAILMRKQISSRIRGFLLSGNRLVVVLSHEKIFLGGYPRIFGGFFSKIFKIQKKF